MTHTDLLDYYEQRKNFFASSLQAKKKKIGFISNLRLAVAVVFLILLYFGFQQHNFLYLLPLSLIAFIILVRIHARLFSESTHLGNLIRVQKYEIQSIEGDCSRNHGGSEFINVHHPYSHDLDIFGEGSLFQYINRSNTTGGRKLMADRLSVKPPSIDIIKSWQEAISELATRDDFRHEVQALSMQTDGQTDDQQKLKQWLQNPSFIYGKKIYRLVLNVFPPITIGLIALSFFIDGITSLAVLSSALQWIFLGFHLKRVNVFHQDISRKKSMLQKYSGILYFIRQDKYNSSLMKSLGSRASRADEKVRQLASLLGAFDARLNSMTNLFVNSLLLYDLQCVYRLEKWKEENASALPAWLDIVCEAEVLCSFGTFAFNNRSFCFPQLNMDQNLSAVGLGHPLLDDKERVVNDLHLDAKNSIMIITGANMAGKSTFLRSLGTNVVLALAGAPVCAKAFDCPFIEIRSGMRTADSLKESQSYFFAELDRLKSIMDDLRCGTPLLILLDEILKGTNSSDKHTGSAALVKQLTTYRCLVLIATHDLSLGDLEDVYPGKVGNYSFEADIQDEQLFFDYKLKRGIALRMNATFLMKKMGIIQE